MRTFLILALLAAAALAQDDGAAPAWKTLHDEYNQARADFFKPWQEAKAAGKEFALDYSKHPDRTFATKYAAFAKEHPGTDPAAQALVNVLRMGTADLKAWATTVLMKDHLNSKALRSATWYFRNAAGGDAHLRTIAEKSPHDDVKGAALITLAQKLRATDAAAAEKLLLELKQKYGDTIYYGKVTFGAKADSEIFEMKRLAVGMVAPEIVGTDLEGHALKLSDYRGKVVLLDFWGDW